MSDRIDRLIRSFFRSEELGRATTESPQGQPKPVLRRHPLVLARSTPNLLSELPVSTPPSDMR